MATESKVQKVAKKGAVAGNPHKVGTCACGGDLVPMKVYQGRPKMARVCVKCGWNQVGA